jgi:hypothetical protein
MKEDPIEAEFIDAHPAAPTTVKCRCPACPTMLDPSARYCDHCRAVCIPLLRKSHAVAPALRQGQADGRALVEGAKAAARTAKSVADVVGTVGDLFSGRAPRRRRR